MTSVDRSAKDAPPVLIHPPVLIVLTLALGIFLEWRSPTALGAWRWVGVPLVLGGTTLALWAMWRFVAAATNIPTFKSASALVTDGPYRWSRNPMYVAVVVIHIGFGLVADNLWIVLLSVPVFAILHWAVIMREERYMTAKFGPVYEAYRKQVRRWL